MKGIAILLIIVIFFIVVWPAISRWLRRKARQRAEAYIRRAMGFPPPPKSSKSSRRNKTSSASGRPYASPIHEPIIPPEYAEDVEFVEIKNYSSTEYRFTSEGTTKIYHESQVSDVEFTEIKNPRNK